MLRSKVPNSTEDVLDSRIARDLTIPSCPERFGTYELMAVVRPARVDTLVDFDEKHASIQSVVELSYA
jgi:hypothetical protein